MNYKVVNFNYFAHLAWLKVYNEQAKVILVDLDGTLALGRHRQHFLEGETKDWDGFHGACGKDEPNENLIAMLQALSKHDHYIIHIVSGRCDSTKDITEFWLNNYSVPCDILTMRNSTDFTEDRKLKLQWVKEFEYTPNNTLVVFEDRQRMVDAWREAGFFCCQVAPGAF